MHSNCGANGQNMQGKGSVDKEIVDFGIAVIIGEVTLLMAG